ncbi:MAG TPA: pyridoxal phosphate-dependent aminotransferase [Burkholderiales bacterium]|nr:pyridoxal phosphate-dependent aminotransferase [Burkholderiales bacterium]
MAQIEAFQVMEVQRRAMELEREGRSIIHMEIGQPDFGAPPSVLKAAVTAIEREALGYTAALGLPALRTTISNFYRDRYGVQLDAERVIVTAGASGAFMLALGALVDPGAEVLMPDPCYPCNRNFVRLFGGIARCIPVDESQAYQLSAHDVQSNWNERTRGVMVATPSNPTGSTLSPSQLRDIARVTAERGGFLLVDEIYQGLQYGSAIHTALEVSDQIYVVNSFSKYFGMTGWRLGWLIAPQDAIRDIERLAQNVFISVSTPAQYAALAAFEPETLEVFEARRQEFEKRRSFLLPRLKALGFRIPIDPDGAFYVYAGCESFDPDSRHFALRLLEEAGVALTPGADFGTAGTERHVRIAYTRPIGELDEGLRRMEAFLKSNVDAK